MPHVNQIPRGNHGFTWVNPATGENRTWDVTGLLYYLTSVTIEVREAVLDEIFLKYILKERGIEEKRLIRLTASQLEEPLIMVPTGDTLLLIDGHHRYVRRWMEKKTTVLVKIVPERISNRFLITGLPSVDSKYLRESYSGIA